MTARFFFYGTLCDPDLLAIVLGRKAETAPAELIGWRAGLVASSGDPVLVPDHHARATGTLVEGLTAVELDRLAFYEEGFGYHRAELTVDGAKAFVYLPLGAPPDDLAGFDLALWQATSGAVVREAARVFMRAFPHITPEQARAAWPMILQRAHSTQRARNDRFDNRVRKMAGGQVIEDRGDLPYLAYFGVAESDIRFQRHAGGMSESVHRAGFLMGDAVTVLPYDPIRDRVLIVEQFRYGPWLRGDLVPWTLEPIAGRIDPGEDPETAARREAVEEAALTLGDLHLVARYYPTPGAVSEYLFSYIALAELPDEAARLGGLDEEGEDVASHLLSFDDLMALIATPEASNGPLILTAFALARLRPELRKIP